LTPQARVRRSLFGCFGLLCASICCAADARSSSAAPHVDSDKMAMVEEKKLDLERDKLEFEKKVRRGILKAAGL